MNLLRRIIKRYKVDEVFTPNTIAKLAYIRRENIDNDLENYLGIPGKSIFIYGHSGSGKTTLLRNILKKNKIKFILTHCESKTSFEDLILQTFDEMEKYYISEKSFGSSDKVSSGLKSDFFSINSNIEKSSGSKEQRIVPIQLTPQKLAKFLGEIKAVWVIEDFHKVAKEEKKRIADVIKIFIDSANDYKTVKIICIGAVGTARELIELDSNLSNRVAELHVPLLSDEHIKNIINKGTNFLNIHIDDSLIKKIVYYSNNLASVAHGLCYDICKENDINKEGFLTKKLNEDSFVRAVNSFVRKNSDTFKKIFDEISSKEYGWFILKAFENSEEEYLNLDQIYNAIPESKRPSESDLINYLNLLSSIEFKEIIRLDFSSKKYCLSSPLFRTFIKMKMELDRTEQSEIHKRELNKKNKKYSLKAEGKEIIFDEAFFIAFNNELDKIIKKKIEEKRIQKVLNIGKQFDI